SAGHLASAPGGPPRDVPLEFEVVKPNRRRGEEAAPASELFQSWTTKAPQVGDLPRVTPAEAKRMSDSPSFGGSPVRIVDALAIRCGPDGPRVRTVRVHDRERT